MGGCSVEDECEVVPPTKTLLLVGKTGNGKSATGNTILQRKAFVSKTSSNGVTSTCETQSTMFPNGEVLNIIDTPGLLDFSVESEFVGNEIKKCISLAKGSIHTVLFVLSTLGRFSQEECNAIQSLQNFFGDNIKDYMIVVFTGGDALERDDETLESYLGNDCPEPLKKILETCENRCVLFNNCTKDDSKVEELLSLVDKVVEKNGGKPFTNDMFNGKNGSLKLNNGENDKLDKLMEQLKESHEAQQKHLREMVELERKMTSLTETKNRSEQEARMLRENLENARREAAEKQGCLIL